MDIEQLKLILETIGAAGSGTKELAVLYFVYLFVNLALKYTIWGGFLYGVYKILNRLIRKFMFEQDVMDALGISAYLTRSEKTRAIKWMIKGKAG